MNNIVRTHAGIDLAALEARFGRAPGVTFGEAFGGPVVRLTAGSGEAVVALKGAQVLSWRPTVGAADVLWLSPVADLGAAKPVRGGIPICWPWFGPHASEPSLPAHGVARSALWRVAGSAMSAGRARLVLRLDTTDMTATPWLSHCRAEIEITLSDTLAIALTTENAGSAPVQLTQALHTYLNVGDIADLSVAGLETRSYIDQLDGGARRTQSGPIHFSGEVDRIYQATRDDVMVRDVRQNRTIRIAKSGSASTVVWNPWIAKGERLGDLGSDGYRHMVCVETANAGDDVVTLQPRARHRLNAELSVQPD